MIFILILKFCIFAFCECYSSNQYSQQMISSHPSPPPPSFNSRLTTHLISSKSRISSHAARIMPLWWTLKYSGVIQRMTALVAETRAYSFFSLFPRFFGADRRITSGIFDARFGTADRREIISHSSRSVFLPVPRCNSGECDRRASVL